MLLASEEEESGRQQEKGLMKIDNENDDDCSFWSAVMHGTRINDIKDGKYEA